MAGTHRPSTYEERIEVPQLCQHIFSVRLSSCGVRSFLVNGRPSVWGGATIPTLFLNGMCETKHCAKFTSLKLSFDEMWVSSLSGTWWDILPARFLCGSSIPLVELPSPWGFEGGGFVVCLPEGPYWELLTILILWWCPPQNCHPPGTWNAWCLHPLSDSDNVSEVVQTYTTTMPRILVQSLGHPCLWTIYSRTDLISSQATSNKDEGETHTSFPQLTETMQWYSNQPQHW